METIVTVAVVAAALFLVGRRLIAAAKGKGGCSCGCDPKQCKNKACSGGQME